MPATPSMSLTMKTLTSLTASRSRPAKPGSAGGSRRMRHPAFQARAQHCAFRPGTTCDASGTRASSRDRPYDLAAAVAHGNLAKLVHVEHLGERGADRPIRAVLALERDPEAVGMRGAVQPFGAALRDPAVAQPHQVGVDRVLRPADELWPRAHRVADASRRAREQL